MTPRGMPRPLITNFQFAASGGKTYYVAPDGGGDNGDPGNQGFPWETLAYAITQVVEGDIIYMLAGTHTIDVAVDIPVGINLKGAGITSIITSTNTAEYFSPIRLVGAAEGEVGNQSISYLKFDGDSTNIDWGLRIIKRGIPGAS